MSRATIFFVFIRLLLSACASAPPRASQPQNPPSQAVQSLLAEKVEKVDFFPRSR